MKNRVSIPKGEAERLCVEISSKYSRKLYTITGLQCWGCNRFSGGNAKRKCYNSPPDYRGCNLVNKVFDRNM